MATKGIKLKDVENNILLPVTSSDLVEVNYGGTSKILTNLLQENEETTAEALVDLNNRIDESGINSIVFDGVKSNSCIDGVLNIQQAKVSYNQMCVPEGGIISGVSENNINGTTGNIVTVPTTNVNGNYSIDTSSTNADRTVLRYETPRINIIPPLRNTTGITTGMTVQLIDTFPTVGTQSNQYKNYYTPRKNINQKSLIAPGGTISYSYLVPGNNYFDTYNNAYEMYYYTGEEMRNYITAYSRIDRNLGNIKELNDDSVLQWGPTNLSGGAPTATLTLEKNHIGFAPKNDSLAQTKTNYTELSNSSIMTPRLTTRDIYGNSSLAVDITNTNIKLLNGNNNCVNLGTTVSYFYHPVYAQKFYETSDERVKSYISRLTNSSNDINIYSFIKNDFNSYSYGFVAQDVMHTHPELVSYSENSYMSVDYNSTLSLLLSKAINRIDQLEKRIEVLEKSYKK